MALRPKRFAAASKLDNSISFTVGKRLRRNLLFALINRKGNDSLQIEEIVNIIDYDIAAIEYMLLTQIELLCQVLVIVGLCILVFYSNCWILSRSGSCFFAQKKS